MIWNKQKERNGVFDLGSFNLEGAFEKMDEFKERNSWLVITFAWLFLPLVVVGIAFLGLLRIVLAILVLTIVWLIAPFLVAWDLLKRLWR